LGKPLAGNNGGNSGRPLGIPDFYAALPVSGDLALGLAVTVPYGDTANYDNDWYGRYLATKAMAVSYDINPAIAYRLATGISVGAGLSLQYLKLDITSSIDQSLILGAPAPDAMNRFAGHDWAFGFNAGVLMDVGEKSRLGVTYRSRTDHDLKGTLNFSSASPFLGLKSGAASANADLPDTASVSLTSEISDDLTLFGEMQFSRWSVFRQVAILSANPPAVNQQHFRDSWMLALGASYRVSPDWSISSGLAFDETPVTSRYRSVILPDTDRYLLGLGAEWSASDNIRLNAAYGHSFALLRPNMNSSVNNTDPVTHAITLQGSYGVSVDILAVSARYSFR
jgi:long-chain fatty acid transport protein